MVDSCLQPIEDGAIDAAIHRVLEGTGKPQVSSTMRSYYLLLLSGIFMFSNLVVPCTIIP